MLNDPIAIVAFLSGSFLGWFGKVLQDHISEKRLFDHRIRLEKEYALYSDLWDKLSELRRAVCQLVDPLSSTGVVRHDEHVLELFNAYQAAVRKGEPFMSTSVFDPARKIATIARKIISSVGERQTLSESIAKGANSDWVVTEQRKLDNENKIAIKEIEGLFQSVATAIHRRVSP